MLLPLALLLVAAPPSVTPAAADDPPVKILLAKDHVAPGDWVRVRTRLGQDGYLLALARDVDGNVRVLFPVDPGDDAFLKGGRTADLCARGGRGSFLVGSRPGTGVVLAAHTVAPLRFEGFARGDHWDYDALDSAARNDAGGNDPDGALLGIVQQMAGGNQLAYDAATYTVGSSVAYDGDPYYHPAYYSGYRYGYPYWYDCYDPFFCGPGFYSAISFGFFYDPFFYRPFFRRPLFIRPVFPRTLRPFVAGPRYFGRGYIAAPRGFTYRNRGNSYSRGYMPSAGRGGYAPRAMAPSFRGGGFAGGSFRGGRGGGGRRR